MDFDLAPEQQDFVKTVRAFVDDAIRPNAERWDEEGVLPMEAVKQMGDLGLFGLPFPEEYGGSGADFFTLCLSIEELARVSSSIAITLEAAVGLGAMPIYRFGNDEQRKKYIPQLASGEKLAGFGLTEPGGGSDAGATKTAARLESGEWIINGSKAFITNSGTPITEFVTITALTDKAGGGKEISAIIVPNGTPGYEVGKAYRKMGWHHSDTHELSFSDVHVPEENLLGERGSGFKNFLQILDDGRIAIAALAVGLAQGCVDECIKYVNERTAFGQTIGKFQAIQFKVADMEMKTQLARNAYYRAAWLAENGRPYKKEAAIQAKLYASEIAVDVAREAVQVHGGYGYIEEFPVCRHFRDSKILEIGEGTSEVMRILIARELGDRLTKQTSYAETILVNAGSDLPRIVDESKAGGIVAIDTEFMREKTYRARLCLVQVATRENLYIIDPLDVPDLGPLAALIPDPEVELVVHAGRQDFEIFAERFDSLPINIFDVQLAAGFGGYGASLPYGRLVEAITGTTLTKGESYTDWCRRPLTDAQLRYAADDVRYLLVVRDVLRDELAATGRLGWVEDEMHILEDPSLYSTDPNEVWRRVSGRGKMSGKQTAVLKELARWREETASRRDIPRGWVVKDQTLVEIARRSPKSQGELKNIRGFPAKESERSGGDIIGAIEKGKAAAPVTAPEGPSRTAQVRARTLSGLADAIVRSRSEAAGVATELLSTRGELEAFLADLFDGGAEESRHRLMRGWRRELAGEAVMDLAAGRIAVRSINKSPYIEEVPLKD